MQQSLKANSLFYLGIPKDLFHYQAEGISPGSAITTNTNAQLQN